MREQNIANIQGILDGLNNSGIAIIEEIKIKAKEE
jgi:hypothetical protein